jgi:hypothetical protein
MMSLGAWAVFLPSAEEVRNLTGSGRLRGRGKNVAVIRVAAATGGKRHPPLPLRRKALGCGVSFWSAWQKYRPRGGARGGACHATAVLCDGQQAREGFLG